MAKSRTAFQRKIDDVLTEEFNNVPTVRAFLLKKIDKLTQHLEERFGDDVRVFIKGGSSLNIMKKVKSDIDPDKWSDFDNQIVINPNLPIYRWYQIFSEVHNYLKEEYMPIFQQDWETFLTCNRKELDNYQQEGLQLFKGQFIDNKVLDFPTLEFSVKDNGSFSAGVKETDEKLLEVMPSSKDEVTTSKQDKKQETSLNSNSKDEVTTSKQNEKKDTSTEPESEIKTHPLHLTLLKGYQSNMVFNSGTVLLHPLNHFDNAMLLPDIDKEVEKVLKKQGLHPDDIFYNSFYPPAPMPLDATLNANENPYSSSILVNNSISKFVLYRVIVRYVTDQYSSEGEPRCSAGDDYKLGPDHKMFGPTLAKFRGELLDVSIPRRDCYETIQQWAQVKTMPVLYQAAPKHAGTWLNVPDWRYQLNENVLLILEVFNEISGSPHKFFKRVLRGCNAVNAINESYKKRFSNTSKELQTLENSISIKSFNNAFKVLSNHKTLGFLRPLVKDLFDTVQNDYGWKNLASSMAKFKIDNAVDVDAIIGKDIEASLMKNWLVLQNEKPDKSSVKTYDDILLKEVKNNDKDKRKQEEKDADYENAKMMLAFMRFYQNTHQAFSTQLVFSDKPKSEYDIKFLNDFRSELENQPKIHQATMCGVLSSMVHTKVMTGESSFHYHLPYVELFVTMDDKDQINTLTRALKSMESIQAMGDPVVFDKDDFKALPSLTVQLRAFALPVVIRILNVMDSKNALNKGDDFESLEVKSAQDLRTVRLKTSGVRGQLSRLFDMSNGVTSLDSNIKEPQKYIPLKDQLDKDLKQFSEETQDLIERANANSYKKQLHYSFNPFSTVCFIRKDASEYRILLAPEAIKHIEMKLTYIESYYQTHWLDHHRKAFKECITRFPAKRIDQAKSNIDIYSNLFEYKPKLNFSAIASSDFSKPLQFQETDAQQVVAQIRTMASWANIGGDIAPLLMSQLLQLPIEVASARSPLDVLQGRLTQIHRFDHILDPNFGLVAMNPNGFNLNLGNVGQHLVNQTDCIRIAKIGNHYWIRDTNGGLTNTDRDGNCFYSAIMSYIVNSPQLSIQSLRTALADYAEGQRNALYQGTNRLQYIIDNIGALENSFRPNVGYHEVAVQDVAALHRGIIRNLKGYLIDGGRNLEQDRSFLHEILRDANAIDNWSQKRQDLIFIARQFVLTGNRPNVNDLPSDLELALI